MNKMTVVRCHPAERQNKRRVAEQAVRAPAVATPRHRHPSSPIRGTTTTTTTTPPPAGTTRLTDGSERSTPKDAENSSFHLPQCFAPRPHSILELKIKSNSIRGKRIKGFYKDVDLYRLFNARYFYLKNI